MARYAIIKNINGIDTVVNVIEWDGVAEILFVDKDGNVLDPNEIEVVQDDLASVDDVRINGVWFRKLQ